MIDENPYGDEEFTETGATEEKLNRLSLMADEVSAKELEVEEAEKLLKSRESELFQLQSKDMPSLMKEIGFDEFKTPGGLKVALNEKVECSLNGKYKIAAFQFLSDTDNEKLIEREVISKFGKGEEERADDVIRAISEAGWTCSSKEKINTASFKALVKEMMSNGEEIDTDKIGVFIRPFVKVVRT